MRKFISLFLAVSFLGMNCATYKRGEGINLELGQKPGITLVFWKLNWQQVEGELIAVKENSLLLKELGTGVDTSVDIAEIRTITIVKKSNLLSGVGSGLIIGVGFGALIGWSLTDANSWFFSKTGENILGAGIILGLLGAVIGGITGALAGTDKTIQIEGKSDAEIKDILEDLRRKARIPNFQ